MIQYTIQHNLSSYSQSLVLLNSLSQKPISQRLFFAFCFVLLCCILQTGCGGTPPPQPAKIAEDPDLVLWPRAKNGVTLRLKATKDLNWYDSKAHSLQVCIYQLEDPGQFLDLARKPNGVESLLKAEVFDKSVKDATRIFIQPGEERVEVFDRVEDGKFIGIVGGYFKSTPAQSVKTWEVDLVKSSEGLIFTTETYSAGTIAIELLFKNHEIIGNKLEQNKKKIKKTDEKTDLHDTNADKQENEHADKQAEEEKEVQSDDKAK